MDKPLTDERIGEIEARANAATEGEWKTCSGELLWADEGCWIGRMFEDHDRQFVAHARSDIPALLSEVRRLRSELSRLHDIELINASIHKGIAAGMAAQHERLVALAGEVRRAREKEVAAFDAFAATEAGTGARTRASTAHQTALRWSRETESALATAVLETFPGESQT